MLKQLTLFCLFALTCLALAQSPQDFAGSWQGAIQIPGSPLEVTVTFAVEEAGLEGSIDIPAQGATDLPLTNISLDGANISFAIQGVPGNPTFDGTLEGDSIEGTFSQSGQQFPFSLARATADTPGEGTAERENSPAALQAEKTETYTSASGAFSVPIPKNWTLEEHEGYVMLNGPEEGIRVYLLATEGEDIEAAIKEAWSQVKPDFGLEIEKTQEVPSMPGVEKSVLVTYDTEEGRIVQAIGQLHQGSVYTLLVEADIAALQRRGAQFNIVASGFTITAIEETDLSNREPKTVDEAMIAELETFTRDVLERFGIPGAALAVVQNGEVVHTGGFGVKKAGGDKLITPQTQMMIGSVGKSLTTMMMGAMVDEGLFDWDTPVVEALPDFALADPELTQTVTMRNLVCACVGVPRRDFELLFNAHDLSAADVVDSLESFELFTDFGEVFQYSNQLVAVAGYAAAAADGAEPDKLLEGYARSLSQQILAPIGMDDTTISFEAVTSGDEYAWPHQRSFKTGEYEQVELEAEKLLLPIAPAGVHWSTAEDMARYLVTLLQIGVAPDGEQVVSEANLRETWEPQVAISAETSYGLGWMISDYKGLKLIHHGGNTMGFTSEVAFLPEADLGIVVITNGRVTNVVNTAIRDRLFELAFGIESELEPRIAFALEQMEETLSELQDEIQPQVDTGKVEPFLGHYRDEALGEIRLTLEGGSLFLEAGEFTSEVLPVVNDDGEPDGYLTVDAPVAGLPLELVTNESGKQVVRFGMGAYEYVFVPSADN